EVKVETPKEAAPPKAKKASASKKDDLTKIEGIGPKAAEALVNAGMETYAKLAKAKADKIKEVLTEASSRLAHLDPTSWPKQSKMAADDKWDELKEWQDNTKGGVE
ncbi:MAG: helix-hairpin-helix domain-containing protein, partial [Maribacter sp.]|nr:helix-hairpin-helix domain-containing protein [Maribacter sp.]